MLSKTSYYIKIIYVLLIRCAFSIQQNAPSETVNGEPCVFPFAYDNEILLGAMYIKGSLWCSLEKVISRAKPIGAYCNMFLDIDKEGSVCDFPFLLENKWWHTCLQESHAYICISENKPTFPYGICQRNKVAPISTKIIVTRVVKNYTGAEMYCKEKGMTLINFEFVKENNVIEIIKLLNVTYFWVEDDLGKSTMRGISLETFYYVAYSLYRNINFNTDESCVHIGFDKNVVHQLILEDQNCSVLLDVICKTNV